ncbi:toll/interleukin-1 receptor domain-containing protein [Corallococcus exiguus]|uniref:toll/interleukin-1 receptor domain-containing protein n=1 Tax=Corallococcus exiguus TaxID=83462 RepID=UPI001494EF13|nr:toll/interleukin-1 receptor domain-containing protein [Corallococcus exiguus]NPD22034.1 toll/interleukin-1 receptor domain-containing protein [Corallococcus exiguus]
MRKTKARPESKQGPEQHKWDVFISHASEDKPTLVVPLAKALRKLGVRVWYDEFTLVPGDSLSRSIDKGLALSESGVIVLSPYFLTKQWPEYELRGLIVREFSGQRVIPVWHNVSREDVARYSPPLADKLSISSKTNDPTEIAIKITEVIRPDIFERIQLRRAFLNNRSKTFLADPATIKDAPIRHKELPPSLVGRVRLIRAALFNFYPHSMKFWLSAFQRDVHPSTEIEVWERIAATCIECMHITRTTNRNELKEIFDAAMMATLGIPIKSIRTPGSSLSAEKVKMIRAFATSIAPPFDIRDPEEDQDMQLASPEQLQGLDLEQFPVDLPNDLLRTPSPKKKTASKSAKKRKRK